MGSIAPARRASPAAIGYYRRAARPSRPREPDSHREKVMAFYSDRLIAMCLGAALGAIASATPAFADDVGQIKVAKGAVHLERGGQKIPAAVSAKVRQGDVIVTGPDGSVGIVF